MTPPALTHRRLASELQRATLRHAFSRGPGAQLLLLWIMSAGAVWVVFQAPLLALALTAALVPAAVALARAANTEARSDLLWKIVERELPSQDVREPALRDALGRSRMLFVEIAGRALAGRLEHVLDTAGSMLQLQLDAARRVDEHVRLSTLVRSKNTLRELADEESRLVTEIGAHLEALLVQLAQLEALPGDVVSRERDADERAETLHCLQARVEAQQQTAAELRRSMRLRA